MEQHHFTNARQCKRQQQLSGVVGVADHASAVIDGASHTVSSVVVEGDEVSARRSNLFDQARVAGELGLIVVAIANYGLSCSSS